MAGGGVQLEFSGRILASNFEIWHTKYGAFVQHRPHLVEE